MFAIYAFPLLGALVLLGSLSDRIGRRTVVTVGTVLLAGSLLLFWSAATLPVLLIARAVQGLAAGLLVPALNAMMVDYEPPGRPGAAALAGTVAPMTGMGVGAIAAGALLDANEPSAGVVFGALSLLLTATGAALWSVPDSSRPDRISAWTTPRLQIPDTLRRPFRAVIPAITAGWVTNGVFLALGPSIAHDQFHTTTRIGAAAPIILLAAAGVVAALAVQRARPRTITLFGTIALTVGAAGEIAATLLDAFPAYLMTVVITGAGFGTAFMGAMRILLPRIHPTHRAGVMAAIYTVSYLAMSLPTILAGLLIPAVGLTTTALTLSVLVSVLTVASAVAVARLHARDEPGNTSLSDRLHPLEDTRTGYSMKASDSDRRGEEPQ